MQNSCKADILLVFDCCASGAANLSRTEWTQLWRLNGVRPKHEILAACGEDSMTEGALKYGANTFTWRVAAAMRHSIHQNLNTDNIHFAVKDSESFRPVPVHIKLTCEQTTILLQPCYRYVDSCPDPGEFLGPVNNIMLGPPMEFSQLT